MFRSILVTGFAIAAFGTAAHATTFDLSTAIGQSPALSLTAGGLTETYTSPAGNGFAVQSTTSLLSFATALLDNNFFGADDLTIAFSSPVANQITIPFAILDAFGTGDTLAVTTNTGQSLTFTASDDGLPLGEPEGTVSFIPTQALTSLTLSSATAFAVGNTTVPEPASMALLGIGLLGVLAVRRRT